MSTRFTTVQALDTDAAAPLEHAMSLTTSGRLLFSGLTDRVLSVIAFLRQPDKWVLLSSCDWYPDGSSFPTNHASLLREESERGGA